MFVSFTLKKMQWTGNGRKWLGKEKEDIVDKMIKINTRLFECYNDQNIKWKLFFEVDLVVVYFTLFRQLGL